MRRYEVPVLTLALGLCLGLPVGAAAQAAQGETYSLERAIQEALANSHDITAASAQ